MKSGNPTISEKIFQRSGEAIPAGEAMTVNGTANKIGILFLILLIGASISWYNPTSLLMWGGAIGGLIVAMITIFKKEWAPVTAPIYAGLEGLFLGAVSVMYANAFGGSGIVFNAILYTLGIFAAMLFIYRTGIITVNKKFRMGVVAATGGIFLVYIAGWILSFFGVNISLITGTGIWGIGFSLVIIVVAALNLVLDFDMIEKGAEYGAPKYFEWYTAFGLIITLVWLYIEMLRLLGKTQE